MPSYVAGRQRGRLLSNEEIADAYRSGESADLIAQRACCSGVTVLQIVRAAGVPVRKPGAPPSPRPRTLSDNEIIRRYRAGEAGTRLADAASCTPGTIYRLLRHHGVEVRPPPNPHAGRRKARRDG